jgi:hypothetical protein
MMTQKSIYILPMEALFYTLNRRRKINGLTEIEHSLIASKLGILFTLKNRSYINFKAEHVELYESQLFVLQELIANEFNIEMMAEILDLAIQRPLQDEIRTNRVQHTQLPKHKGLFSQIKGFLKVQANPA